MNKEDFWFGIIITAVGLILIGLVLLLGAWL